MLGVSSLAFNTTVDVQHDTSAGTDPEGGDAPTWTTTATAVPCRIQKAPESFQLRTIGAAEQPTGQTDVILRSPIAINIDKGRFKNIDPVLGIRYLKPIGIDEVKGWGKLTIVRCIESPLT